MQGWTTRQAAAQHGARRVQPRGGTALYDAVAEAVPLAQSGHNRKKALVIISDGNDTSSRTDVRALKRMIRETEVLVYAIGIDSQTDVTGYQPRPPSSSVRGRHGCRFRCRSRCPAAAVASHRRPRRRRFRQRAARQQSRRGRDDRVNVAALREITDDSGGRTEIIRGRARPRSGDRRHRRRVEPQYLPGYAATGVKDGRWHTIRVELRNPSYQVRARARIRRVLRLS